MVLLMVVVVVVVVVQQQLLLVVVLLMQLLVQLLVLKLVQQLEQRELTLSRHLLLRREFGDCLLQPMCSHGCAERGLASRHA